MMGCEEYLHISQKVFLDWFWFMRVLKWTHENKNVFVYVNRFTKGWASGIIKCWSGKDKKKLPVRSYKTTLDPSQDSYWLRK
jgi:hypothetical protein